MLATATGSLALAAGADGPTLDTRVREIRAVMKGVLKTYATPGGQAVAGFH
jgi:hypothetical protein